jgi:uncharacterized membrane protein
MSFGALLLALHVLGAMLWVGGLFFALAVLRPGMAFLEAPLQLTLHEQVLRRFFLAIWYVMPVMLLTGIAMAYVFYGGIGSTPWPLQAMTATGVAMAAIFVVIIQGPWHSFRRALAKNEAVPAAAAVQRIRRLVTVSLALGVLTSILAVLDY